MPANPQGFDYWRKGQLPPPNLGKPSTTGFDYWDKTQLFPAGETVSAGGSLNGSATILALAGILAGLAGMGMLPSGIAASPALGGGINAAGSAGGGLSAQGELQASSAATPSETFQGSGALSSGVSAQAGLSGGISGQAALSTGQSGSAALGGGVAGQGAVSASSAATPSLTLQGMAGFISGFGARALINATGTLGGAINGAATILGIASLLGGLAGQGNLNPSSAATPSLTLGGVAGLLGGAAGQAILSAVGNVPSLAKPFSFAATALKQLLNFAFATKPKVSFVFGATQALNFSFTRSPALPTPNTTITVTVTATDQSGNPVSNLATCTCQITFPDGTQSTLFSLVSTPAIQNLGAGKYSLTYNTKTVGEDIEEWKGVDSAGNICDFKNITPVSF